MNCAKLVSVSAFCAVLNVLTPVGTVFAKEGKENSSLNSASNNNATTASVTEFRWNEHNKLSWEDFKGPVNASNDESAAATHCGIGFRINTGKNGKPEVTVYNTFYTRKSWVRPDAKISTILDHEQGHFDLCEIYTRKLRERMSTFNFNVPDVKDALMTIFSAVNDEYEARQQEYEDETTHGTNLAWQKKWQDAISQELN